MKKTIFLTFSLVVLTGLISAQTNRSWHSDRQTISDTLFSKVLSQGRHLNNHNDSVRLKIRDRKFDLNPDQFFNDSLRLSRPENFVVVEEYPGSSRYFGNVFNIKPGKGGKLIIKEPDTSNKYYLIVLDPIRHTTNR